MSAVDERKPLVIPADVFRSLDRLDQALATVLSEKGLIIIEQAANPLPEAVVRRC
jgi:hypothetical protein